MTHTGDFIDPTAGSSITAIALAPRLPNLAGAVVGLLDNTKEQGAIILQTVGEVLRAQYGVARVLLRRKEHYSKPASMALLDKMAQEVQVAVTAVGG
jgi:hypothetical protein